MSKKKKKQDKQQEPPAPTVQNDGDQSSAEDTGAEEQLTHETNETEVLQERLLRLQADFENYRKRMAREKEDIVRLSNKHLMEEMLPVLDHIEMALNAASEYKVPTGFLDGVKMVMEQLRQVLAKFGLKPIDADGTVFDPHQHEAISHLKSDSVPDHHVIAQTRRGYCLGDKVLRAAQVVVSDGPTETSQPETPPEPTENSREINATEESGQ